MYRFLFFLCLSTFLFLPVRAAETSFYCWKTSLDFSQGDLDYFKNHGVHRLYVRAFDLDWDDQEKKFYERSPLMTGHRKVVPPEIVPVVYITIPALWKMEKKNNFGLASRILKGCDRVVRSVQPNGYSEIQIDCDWTPGTREVYFDLLREIRNQLDRTGKKTVLSATIRLHEVKYRQVTGVPPVDRGVLMVYHVSTPRVFSESNSILDEKDALAYLDTLPTYPLPLDVALPLFGWGGHYNTNQKFLSVFRVAHDDPVIDRGFRHLGGTLYLAKEDLYLGGVPFMKGDYLRLEQSDHSAAERLEKVVLQKHPNDSQRVIWFEYSHVKELE
jgi:hypothetical protein